MLLIKIEGAAKGTIEGILHRRLAGITRQIHQIPVVGGVALQHLLARIPARLQRLIDRQTLVHRVAAIEYQEGKGVEVGLTRGVSRVFRRQIVVQVHHDVGGAGGPGHHGQPLVQRVALEGGLLARRQYAAIGHAAPAQEVVVLVTAWLIVQTRAVVAGGATRQVDLQQTIFGRGDLGAGRARLGNDAAIEAIPLSLPVGRVHAELGMGGHLHRKEGHLDDIEAVVDPGHHLFEVGQIRLIQEIGQAGHPAEPGTGVLLDGLGECRHLLVDALTLGGFVQLQCLDPVAELLHQPGAQLRRGIDRRLRR